MWRTVLYLLFFFLAIVLYMLMGRLLDYNVYQATELSKFSELKLCSENGRPMDSKIGSKGEEVFIVPQTWDKIFVCGSVETPNQINLGMYVFKGDEQKAFAISPQIERLSQGSFIAELISVTGLTEGIYRVDLHNGQYKLAFIEFVVVR